MGQPQLLRLNSKTVAKIGGLPMPNGQAPLRSAMLADNPIALWRGGDSGAVLAEDIAARNGTFVEPVMRRMLQLTADPDTSLGFPGVGTVGYATVPWVAALAPASPWSIACVFMPGAWPGAGLAGLFDARLLNTNGFMVGITSTGQPSGIVGTGAAGTQLSGTAGHASIGVPHIIVLTYDGANARLYLDGILEAGPTATAYSANPSQALRMGYNVSGAIGFQGYGQLFAIFGSTLSQARVTAYSAALTSQIADLNDYVNTVLVDYLRSDDANRQIGLEQLLYRARGVYTSDDFGPRPISLPMTYFEDATHFIGQFLAALSQAGEQNLTFDNATVIPVLYKGASSRQPARARQPLAWDFHLELMARIPWFSDIAMSAPAAITIVTDTGQTFNVTYAGSVFCEPVWILQIPATNAVAINSIQILNTMSGESLTVNFLSVAAIPAATAATIRIDTALMTAVDNLGNSYDVVGSFPQLYGPAGQVNPFKVIVTPASGASAGLQLSCQFYPRWQI